MLCILMKHLPQVPHRFVSFFIIIWFELLPFFFSVQLDSVPRFSHLNQTIIAKHLDVYIYFFPQNIFNNHMLDVNVRWLAVLYFKNGIDRYWRRVAPQ